MKKRKRLGILGLGRMGTCLVGGILESKSIPKEDILFSAKSSSTRERAEKELGIKSVAENRDLVDQCETLLVAVKPQALEEVLRGVASALKPDQTLLSIAASVSTLEIERIVKKKVAVIRAMPNTPAFVREGITGACLGTYAGDRDWKRAAQIFEPVGKFIRVAEAQMDAVTGLSGSGPAYVYVLLESLVEGGIKVGLSREIAMALACQTVLGAAKMLQVTQKHPAALKDEVTTPAGCTIDGLMELEDGKLRMTLIKAVQKSTERARAISTDRDRG